jgi:hypothetical protein
MRDQAAEGAQTLTFAECAAAIKSTHKELLKDVVKPEALVAASKKPDISWHALSLEQYQTVNPHQ